MGIGQAGANIIGLKIRIIGEDRFRAFALRQQA
jgi:hypothetical protein